MRTRVESLDLLRGLVMIVMALDHTRDFLTSAHFDPTDATQTTPVLFATRWITHLCAPVFVLLAGAGARLSLGRGRSRGELARYLLTRGLWLVILEVTLVHLAWMGPDYEPTHYRFLVISTLGFSMIALAGLIYLPMPVIIGFGVALVAGHDLLDSIDPSDLGSFAWLWNVLHVPGMIGSWAPGKWALFVLYPLIPWIGVMALGYAFGALVERPALQDDRGRRARLWLIAGGAMLVAFVAIRALDTYGDPAHWAHQATDARTVMAFLDVSKYPPSLDYLLATVGVAAIVLAGLEHLRGPIAAVLRTYGRVPLFFYLLHIPLIHLVSFPINGLINGVWSSHDPGWGFGLPMVYAVWLGVVAALYLPCRWFGDVKARRRDWWLGYL